MRKNQYEEALFRCEDDRFELDMAIECSQSAVRALTAVAEEISKLDAEGKERYRLDKDRVLSIHFRMVQKIYGAMPGMLDLSRPPLECPPETERILHPCHCRMQLLPFVSYVLSMLRQLLRGWLWQIA